MTSQNTRREELIIEHSGLIETRTMRQIYKDATFRQVGDTVHTSLPREKRLTPFGTRAAWLPRDAALMNACMKEFWESPFGILAAAEILYRLHLIESDQLLSRRSEILTHMKAAEQHSIWCEPELMTVLAQDSFVDMAMAAALTAPSLPLRREELMADHGVVYFVRERMIEQIHPTSPLRGLVWSLDDEVIDVVIYADGHHERDTKGINGYEPPVENYAYLYARAMLRVPLVLDAADAEKATAEDLAAMHYVFNLIRSIGAISRSPRTKDETKIVQRRVKKHGRVRSVHDDPIRILSLHNPEHGGYELDAATGRKMRQHWVRGHWRNQWYASIEEHRTIWIDGFIKGDSELGTMASPKVYVARS